MLAAADVASYLLDRRLLAPCAVVDGGLHISDRSGLNRVFVVTAEGAPPLVVKVGARVEREAAVLERLRIAARGGGLESYLPTVIAHDHSREALVLGSARAVRDLSRHHAGGRFSSALASKAGRALALLHAVPSTALDGLRRLGRPAAMMRLHEPDLDTVHSMSPASRQLIRLVQGLDDLCAALDALATSAPDETVIHGDIRWDNLLAVQDAASKRWGRLQIIDWEHCDVGDPAVDVGAFLGEYLRAWLRSIPIADPEDPARLLAHARRPLRRMRPALRAFWSAYAAHGRAPAAGVDRRLRRAVDLAAVRLLEGALEEAQTLDQAPARVVQLVRLSRNILCRRDDAAVRLLGLDDAWVTG